MRKKEKPLSIDELREKVRKESSANWTHNEPLFGIANTPEGSRLISTSEITDEQVLVVFLLDAGDYVTDRIFEVLGIWKERYKRLNYKPVLVFQQNYMFLKNKKFFERFKNVPLLASLPIYLDPFGELFEKYGSTQEPTVFFLNRGNLTYSTSLKPDFGTKLLEVEAQLQKNLRVEDPGLSLPLLYQYEISAPVDVRAVKPSELTRDGQWIDGRTSLVTDDPHATLTFGFEGKNLRFISTLHAQARENAKIQITFDGGPVPRALLGSGVHANEKGQTILEITRNTGIFEVIQSDAPVRGIVRFHFFSVIETPVIFYELRVA